MFELTNDQRKCFALLPVNDQWERIDITKEPDSNLRTILYLDGDHIVKFILSGKERYCESELSETVSPDRKYLLPKTNRGKPVILTPATIEKRTGIGMCLTYASDKINLYNERSQCSYYHTYYLDNIFNDINDFATWVENWCHNTTEADIADITLFAQSERKHIRFQEGDVFRFKIDRRLYGYGRILLDYGKMRKQKIPFWDMLAMKPLVCNVYHIVTERNDVSPEELKDLPSLPSTIIADNSLYYGEFLIIGNIPISDNEDYPIMYGRSVSACEKAICYQHGKIFSKLENVEPLYTGHRNGGVSFILNSNLNVLKQCIESGSNDPYWQRYLHKAREDLRSPQNAEKLLFIRKQFGLQ